MARTMAGQRVKMAPYAAPTPNERIHNVDVLLNNAAVKANANVRTTQDVTRNAILDTNGFFGRSPSSSFSSTLPGDFEDEEEEDSVSETQPTPRRSGW